MLKNVKATQLNTTLVLILTLLYALFTTYLLSDIGLRFALFVTTFISGSLLVIPLLRQWTTGWEKAPKARVLGITVVVSLGLWLLAGLTANGQVYPTLLSSLEPVWQFMTMLAAITSLAAFVEASETDEILKEIVANRFWRLGSEEFAGPGRMWMILLWVVLLVAFGRLLALPFDRGLHVILPQHPLTAVLLIPLAIVGAVGHWQTQQRQKPPIWQQGGLLIAAIALAIAAYLFITHLWQLPQLWGAVVPDFLHDWDIAAWRVITAATVLALTLEQRHSLSPGIRIIVVATIGSGLAAILLAYPVYVGLFDRFLPVTIEVNQWAMWGQILLAGIWIAGVGPVSVAWIQPSTRYRQMATGAVTGAMAGGFLWGLLVGPVAVVAAQNPLFGAAVSRMGYGGYDWILQLAYAVNGVLPAALVSLWFLWAAGAIVGGLTSFVMPLLKTEEETSAAPLETLAGESLVVGGVLVLTLVLVVEVATMALLPENIQNIFNLTGSPPPLFHTNWGNHWYTAQHLIFLVLQTAVFLFWFYRRAIPLAEQTPADREVGLLFTQVGISGGLIGFLPIAIGSTLYLVSPTLFTQPVLLALILTLIALGLELLFAVTAMRAALKRTPKIAPPPPIVDEQGWGVGWVWGGFMATASYQFLLAASGMIFIAVQMITTLVIPADPPIGTTALTEIALTAIWVGQAAFPWFILLGLIFSGATKDPLIGFSNYLHDLLTGEVEPPPLTTRQSILSRIPFLQRPYRWVESLIIYSSALGENALILIVVAFVLLLFTTNPLLPLVLLSFAMLLWPSGRYLDRIPWPVFTITFLFSLVGIILAGLPTDAILSFMWDSPGVRLLFGVMAALTLRAFHLYHRSPGRSQSLRLLLSLAGIFLIIVYTINPQGVLNPQGSVARLEGETWHFVPQLAGRVGYDFFQTRDGRFYYITNTGLIVEQVTGQWQRHNPFPLPDAEISPFDLEDLTTAAEQIAQFNQKVLTVEDHSGHLWVALGQNFGRFNPAYYYQQGEKILQNPIYLNETGEVGSITQDADNLITAMTIDDAGHLWVATQNNGLIRIDTNLPMENTQWQTFTTTNSNLPTDHIHALLYAQGKLWLGTDVGVMTFEDQQTEMLPGEEEASLPIVFLAENTQGGIWAGGQQHIATWDGTTWVNPLNIQLNDPGSDTAVPTTYFLDSMGWLWVGSSNGFHFFNGQVWQSVGTFEPIRGFVEESPDVIWVGQGTQIVRQTLFRESGVLTVQQTTQMPGPIRDIAQDADGSLWVSTLHITQTTQSATWSLAVAAVILIGICGSTFYGLQHAPETRARRLERMLYKRPDTLYPTIYHLLATKPDASDVLSVLAHYLHPYDPIGAQTLLSLNEDVLNRKAGEVFQDDRRAWAEELNQLYQVIAAAQMAHSLSTIAALELAVIPGTKPGQFYLTWRDGKTPLLPPFLPAGTQTAWKSLEQVGGILRKYEAVDAATDRLAYLAQALTALETAQAATAQVGLPEGPVLQGIVTEWKTAVTNKINTIGGRAELRLELRTRQVRRAEQITIALRLQNVGRAAAEDVTICLYQEGKETGNQVLNRLPSGRAEMIEFSLSPPPNDTLRFTCYITWRDLTEADQNLEFGDVVQFYETAQQFLPIPNPYIVGHPVKSADMFHGREDIFRFIAQNLTGTSDRTLVLHGQRRTGKTSILYQLLNGRLGTHFLPLLIDMQELAPIIHHTADFLGEIAYQLARTVQKAGIEINEPPIEEFEKSAVRVFSRFLDRLEDRLNQRRVVIMFDEFELIENKIREGKLEADLMGYFRSLMQHRQGVVFIFTGTHRLEEMSHDYWSILFNIALYRRVSFLNRPDAVQLIRKPVADKLDVDELAVEKILALTGGHAYFTQLLCWALVNHCNAHQQNYATINDVNDAVNEIIQTGEAHFAYIWQQVTSQERLVLAALAHTMRPGKPWTRPLELLEVLQQAGDQTITRPGLVDILDHLVLQEVLESATEGNLRYRFQLEILQLWVAVTQSVVALIERQQE